MASESSYQKTVKYLYDLQKHGIKLSLSNSQKLMDVLGDPHRKFVSVHVAGTNGKGSTAAFLASILNAAGYRVGLYTSPHLIDFTERIRVNNVPISEDAVIRLTQHVRGLGNLGESGENTYGLNPTFFEVTTALAFAYFAEQKIDIGVIEVGMGGRLDATNVITPLVSLITNIDLEHQEFLGTTLGRIAQEKAGIIKTGIPVVTGTVQTEAIDVIESTAAAKQAPLHRLWVDFKPKNTKPGPPQVFDYQGGETSYRGLRIGMLGAYQVENACLAVRTIERLQNAGMLIDEAAVRRGLEQTRWEGRMERVGTYPAVYLDGAHNPASAKKLGETVRQIKGSFQRIILVIGVLGDKDYRSMVTEIVPLADHVVVTRPQYARALDPRQLEQEIKKLHDSVERTDSIQCAIKKAMHSASPGDLVLITGSLYVVGEARALFPAGITGANRSGALAGLKG